MRTDFEIIIDQPGVIANPARRVVTGKMFFPRPRSRLRIRSRETGSAVPSCVSPLISILRLNLVLTHGIPPAFRDGVQLLYRQPPSSQSWVVNCRGHK